MFTFTSSWSAVTSPHHLIIRKRLGLGRRVRVCLGGGGGGGGGVGGSDIAYLL